MYADVQFNFSRSSPPLVVPASALLPLTDGIRVVEVSQDSRVYHRRIRINRDYGSYVETDSGLVEGANVVVNPTDGLTDGLEVRAEMIGPADGEPAPSRPVAPTRPGN